jgi:hypothetical protein
MNRSGKAQSSSTGQGRMVAQVIPYNVTMIESMNPDFPVALRHGTLLISCPRIWAIGNLDILRARLLGFFCSTKCPGNVIVHTYDLARALRNSDVPVIGGFQSPMEKECLYLLLRGQQPIVICPARRGPIAGVLTVHRTVPTAECWPCQSAQPSGGRAIRRCPDRTCEPWE